MNNFKTPEDEIQFLRDNNRVLHNLMLVYLVEIQKSNKGIRRLKRKLEKRNELYMELADQHPIEKSSGSSVWRPRPELVILFWAICVSNVWMNSIIVLLVGFGVLCYERLYRKNSNGQ